MLPSVLASALAFAFVAPLPAVPPCTVTRVTPLSMGLLKTLRDAPVAPSNTGDKTGVVRPTFAERLSKMKSWRPLSWRAKAAVQDALLTAGVHRGLVTRVYRNRDVKEDQWEESCLPRALDSASRDLAEDGWEDRLLPSMQLATPRRNLAENSWEDRLTPRPLRLRSPLTRDLSEDSWEEHLVPGPTAASAATMSSLDSWEDRLLPGI